MSEVVIDFAGTEWQKALERGTKSPWTWHFTTLGLYMEPVSASRLFEPLRVWRIEAVRVFVQGNGWQQGRKC